MKYEEIKISDIDLVESYFRNVKARTCDFTIGTLFMWRDYNKLEYTIIDDTLLFRYVDELGKKLYTLPIGDISKAVESIKSSTNEKAIMFGPIPETYLDEFKNLPYEVSIMQREGMSDYLYEKEKITSLVGKPYRGQRNHINAFLKSYPNWSFEAVTDDNIKEAEDYFTSYVKDYPKDSLYAKIEADTVFKMFHDWDYMKKYMFGGILRIEGKIVGFSFGEYSKDTLFCHVEKAEKNLNGAYPMLTHEFLKMYDKEGIAYVNREEDMGDEGLRQSKMSYRPVDLLNKYTVQISL